MGSPRVVVVGGGLSGLISFAQALLDGAHGDIVEKASALGGTERNFTNDLGEENKGFLKEIGMNPEELSEGEKGCQQLKEGLISFIKKQGVKKVRVMLETSVVSILTNQERSSTYGIHFRRSFSNQGKAYSPDGNIFGDAVIFALTPEAFSEIWCQTERVPSEEVLRAQSSPSILSVQNSVTDLFASKETAHLSSLEAFVSTARKAGKSAAACKPRQLNEKGIRQPLPFLDKDGVFHGVALQPDNWVPFVLENRIQLNKFNHLFRFALPNKSDQCGLFCGQYISIRAKVDGNDIIRYYSPVSRNSDYGQLDLMIKIEENTTNKPMEKFMSELKVGDTIEFKGPMGGFEYHRNTYREVGMIAGGTGITPMVQIIRSVANHPEDETRLKLLYGNYNEEDILCRDELSYYTLTRSNIDVFISLVNPPGKWSMGTGFVSKELIAKSLPAPAHDIIILLCGPPPMIKANIVMLKEMGYTDQMIFSFI